MRCPTLAELPPPPEGKTSWPWTEETPQIDETMPDGQTWPKVSIVTPSYNQGQFLEETIRSILLQGYPNLEYCIIDGGSTDESREIIQKYEPWIDFWVSEPDNGQTDALNKGFKRTTGEVAAWLNSDDLYTKGSMIKAVDQLMRHPDVVMVYGECQYIDEFGKPIFRPTFRPKKCDYSRLLEGCFIAQPSVYFKKKALEQVGYINASLQYSFDYELWLSIARSFKIQYVKSTLSKFRIHSHSKTGSQTMKFMIEGFKVLDNILRTYKDTGDAIFTTYNNLILRVVFARQDAHYTGQTLQIGIQGNKRDFILNSSSEDFFQYLVSQKSVIDGAGRKVQYRELFDEISKVYITLDTRYQNEMWNNTSSSRINGINSSIREIPIYCLNHGDVETSQRIFRIIARNHLIWVLKIPLLKYVIKKMLDKILEIRTHVVHQTIT